MMFKGASNPRPVGRYSLLPGSHTQPRLTLSAAPFSLPAHLLARAHGRRRRQMTRIRMWLLMLVVCAGASAAAQSRPAPQEAFEPQVGQAGKDVVWVPTPDALVEKMLDLANVTPQ